MYPASHGGSGGMVTARTAVIDRMKILKNMFSSVRLIILIVVISWVCVLDASVKSNEERLFFLSVKWPITGCTSVNNRVGYVILKLVNSNVG